MKRINVYMVNDEVFTFEGEMAQKFKDMIDDALELGFPYFTFSIPCFTYKIHMSSFSFYVLEEEG